MGAEGSEEFGFTDAADARRYLIDYARLWGSWVVAMALLFTTSGAATLVAGIGALVALVAFAIPMHARARRLVEEDEVVGTGWQIATGRGTKRDRAQRALTYGEAPLKEALSLAGMSEAWLWARRFVVALTVAVLVLMIFR